MKNTQNSHKKATTAILWTLIVIAALASIFIIISCIGSNSNTRYIESNFAAVGSGENPFFIDEDTGYYTIEKPVDRDLKILHLTDSHIGGGIFCQGKDKQAFDAIYKMIAGTSPDLVVFTGDVLYPFPFQSGNINNKRTAEQFAAFMEKLQVPWTLIFGNHDNESYSIYDREDLADYFASDELEYCIFTKNPEGENLSGYGNQIINIENADGTLNSSLFLFDSHSTLPGNMFKYDSIKEDQVKWYSRSVAELSSPENGFADGEVVPSLAFIHIPLNEYREAWDAYQSGSPDAVYQWGVCDENILDPAVDKNHPKCKLFDVMLQLNSTKAVYCGHNHKNNFSIVYKGIELNYSKSIVYLGLFGIHKTDAYRGGSIITIDGAGAHTTYSVGINEAEDFTRSEKVCFCH